MSDVVIGILTGAALFGLYTWWLVDVAATVAVKRIERQFAIAMEEDEDDQDDIIDRLDRMWRKRND